MAAKCQKGESNLTGDGLTANQRYERSEKARARYRRYNKTPKGRERHFNYRRTPKYAEKVRRYQLSPKGRETQWSQSHDRNK